MLSRSSPPIATSNRPGVQAPSARPARDKIARQCAAEGVDHLRYLLRLAEVELIDRERRMFEFCHSSSLSRVGASGKPGAVQSWNWRAAHTSSAGRM